MERLTIPDVRVDEHTTRRSVIDVLAVREHAMEFYFRLKAYEDMVDLETLNNTPISRLAELAEADRDGRVVVKPCKVGETVYSAPILSSSIRSQGTRWGKQVSRRFAASTSTKKQG